MRLEDVAREQQRFVDRYDEAAALLRRVPGVLSVGVGVRERGGAIVPELAFRVYVAEKLDESVLPEADRVPRDVCGLPTDVLVHPDIEEMQFSPAAAAAAVVNWDSTKYRPLKGGSQIRTERFEGDNKRGMGTLGCLAKMADGTMVALTAQHVACAGSAYALGAGPAAGMAGGGGGGGVSFACVGVKVGQPRHVTCCCCCTLHEIGSVLRAEKTAELDCATVKLDDDIAKEVLDNGTLNQVVDVGPITGSTPAVLLSEVRKRGAATGLTRGTVVDIAFEGNQILINPLPAFPRFAFYGDSGAVVVDAGGKVVGLLWGADRATGNRGVANHIAPVIAAMGITMPQGYNVKGPPNVPGLSEYNYQLDVPGAAVVTGIAWTVDKASASIVGPANQKDVKVRFNNAAADWIKLGAAFTIDGNPATAEVQIALVQVTVDPPTFTNPGQPVGSAPATTKSFLVTPPALPTVESWVLTHDPGSDSAAFVYNGTSQAGEPRQLIQSDGAGLGGAFNASTKMTLTSPAERPDAHTHIQIGYIQDGVDAGSAAYTPGTPRTVTTPTNVSVDWLSGSPGDEWPWYDVTARDTGSGASPWSVTLAMQDSPALSIPAQRDPLHGGAQPLVSAAETFSFTVRIAARTLHVDMDAHKHYFDESHSTWVVNYAWPVVPGVSIVTLGAGWTVPAAATEVQVNVVPTSINHNGPYLRWVP